MVKRSNRFHYWNMKPVSPSAFRRLPDSYPEKGQPLHHQPAIPQSDVLTTTSTVLWVPVVLGSRYIFILIHAVSRSQSCGIFHFSCSTEDLVHLCYILVIPHRARLKLRLLLCSPRHASAGPRARARARHRTRVPPGDLDGRSFSGCHCPVF